MSHKKDGLTFKPKEVTKRLLSVLSDRAKNILIKRYGLGKELNYKTLEKIGQEYGITRERIRQIENFSLNIIRKSNEFKSLQNVFDELKSMVEYHGGVIHEREFLSTVAKDESDRNHLHFLFVLATSLIKLKEDEEFHHRWTVNQKVADRVHESIRNLCQNFSQNDLISEKELIKNFLKEITDIAKDFEMPDEELALKWLQISKQIGKNPLGEWGLAKSPNVRMRGIRDYAYLVIRHHGSPMHFTEVAKQIHQLFGKKAHPATCHNELIKDNRFVLVGRGLYALSEWGYSKGVVADVIRAILKKNGPLTREDIISRVLKERYVKKNTILVNLQNTAYFKRDKIGRYCLV